MDAANKENKRFVNPYNFIPLGNKCLRGPVTSGKQDVYTGFFECSMKLLTPLFIPNTSSTVRLLEEGEYEIGKDDYKGFDFFSYEDYSKDQPYIKTPPAPPQSPVIPGSEIRGVVRSVYEAAFNGCMSSIDGDRELSRRCGDIKKPGILYWDEKRKAWYLKKCKKARLRVEQKDAPEDERYKYRYKQVNRGVYDRWKEGQEMEVTIGPKMIVSRYRVMKGDGKDEHLQGNPKKGYLHKGEYIKRKTCEAVFYEDNEPNEDTPRKVFAEDIKLLERVLSEYRDKKKNVQLQDEGWYREFKLPKDGTRIFVYYVRENTGHVYLCPACIGREAYKKTIKSLLENNGGYSPCSSKELCPACQIFGMMDKTEKATDSYGSKVRITDAVLKEPDIDSSDLFEAPVVLPELGEPRPSAVEFYTETPFGENEKDKDQEGQGYWTYDYKYLNISPQKGRVALNAKQPKIRGRKYYWHKVVDLNAYKDNQVNEMRQRIRPLKPNQKPIFRFRLYFEQLDKKQIEQLKWALDFGNTECAHKMGRGKPLGFGSVQIIVDSLQVREIDKETGRWNLSTIDMHQYGACKKFFELSGFSDQDIPDALKLMSNWKERPDHVSYPIGVDKKGDNKGEGPAESTYQWFKLNNKKIGADQGFLKVLPTALEDGDKKLGEEKALYKLFEK